MNRNAEQTAHIFGKEDGEVEQVCAVLEPTFVTDVMWLRRHMRCPAGIKELDGAKSHKRRSFVEEWPCRAQSYYRKAGK